MQHLLADHPLTLNGAAVLLVVAVLLFVLFLAAFFGRGKK